MKRAFLYVGGEVNPQTVTEHPTGEDLVIAVDSGYHNALALGETPQVLIGDFDSIGGDHLPPCPEIFQHPPEKNLTDTQLAVDLALSRGAESIVIIGGLSGRLDHTLSNLSILEKLQKLHVRGLIHDGRNRVRFLKNDGLLLPRSGYRYFGILAADEKVRGLTLEGCKYPLQNGKLERHTQYAVSNEIVGNCALIDVKKGGIFVVESGLA